MVQAPNLWERDDPPGFRSLDWPWLRGVLVQSEMRSTLVIIVHEATEVVAKAAFTGDDHVIQAFPADRADHAFDVGALPGRAGVDKTCDMPMAVTWSTNVWPKMPSRSRSR
jgi:hypothetical protein